jgi:hypothetical protein
LPNPFEDNIVQTPSSCWAKYFSDLLGTLLKNGRKSLVAFQKNFAKIWEICQPIGKKGLKFQR